MHYLRVSRPVRMIQEPLADDEVWGHYVCIGNYFPPLCGQDDFSLKKNSSPRYFMIMNGPLQGTLREYLCSHNYVF